MLTANRAEQLLRRPFDTIDWPGDTDADYDEPIVGQVVKPCCPICHAPRWADEGFPSCPGAPFPYIAGVTPDPPRIPRPHLCRFKPVPQSRQRLGLDRLVYLHTLYLDGWSFDRLGREFFRALGYSSPRSCADALRFTFQRIGWTVRKQGRPRKAA